MSDTQFGFSHKHSTTHALPMVLDKVAHAVDNMVNTVDIFLGFSRALDTINHNMYTSIAQVISLWDSRKGLGVVQELSHRQKTFCLY